MAKKTEVSRVAGAMPGIGGDAGLKTPVLTETDASFCTLFLDNPQPMWVFDLQTFQFLEVNEAAILHYGYSRAEFLQMQISQIRPPDDVSRLEEDVVRNREKAQTRGEWNHRIKDGSLIHVDVVAQMVTFRGRLAKLVVLRDITKQKQAEEALQQAERKYRLIFEEAMVGLCQTTPDGRVLSANPAMARLYGFESPEEFAAHISDIRSQLYVDPTRRDEFQRLMEAYGMVRHLEVQVYRKDGSKMWLTVNGRAVREEGVVVHYDATAEDITELKNLQDQLQDAQNQYRDIFENAVVGIFQSSPEGRYLKVNSAMAKMLGYDSPQELVNSITNIAQQIYVDPGGREHMQALMGQHGIVQNMENQVYRKDGSKAWFSANVRAILEDGILVRYEGMNEDITQRKLLEDQLRQAQKMEAVGQLAGGVAHDFNNALGVITGYSDLLQMNLPGDSAAYKQAGEIAKAGRRAAALTRQLLAFSRKQVIQPVVLDLNSATAELEKMLRRLIGEHIEITFRRSPDLGRVKMDPGQVEQVLMNLCVNARDAMPQGGRLCIETANVELDEIYARQNAYVIPGSYVMLSVSDTGFGMDRETQRRIFEPFFTTKDSGKGTGLGLSTVYGIAKQNNGYVIVYSEPGKGSTFRLYVPRLEGSAKLPTPPPAVQAIPHGTETILVVEDEEALRMLARTCLESNGYRVIDAADPASALDLAGKYSGRIDLLLSDVVMPGMGGREMATRLAALQPEVRVLYMSGYTNDLIDQHGILDGHTGLLEKPFTLQGLLAKVHKSLHADNLGKAAAN